MIWFKRIAFILFVLLFLFAGVACIIVFKYEDDMKEYALETVHNSIETEVSFDENVVLSLWKDFPLVAVEIKDIQIQDSFRKDTLLKVEKAFVQFDVFKLLQNRFTIEGIRVTDGFLRLRRSENNRWNFRVWKEQEKDAPSKTDFSIEILTLQNVHLDYDDRVIDLNIQFYSEKSRLKGRFTDENTRLGLSLNGFMERLTTTGDDRIVELPLSLAGVLNINSKDGIYTIEMGNAVLAGNEMVLDAEWKRVENGTDMQMKVHAGNIEPFVLLPHVWPQMPENIRKLNLSGRADLIFSLNGPFTKTQGPQLDATIRMRDGGLIFQETDVHDLNFEGKLYMKDIKRSKAMQIDFDSFELKTPEGNVQGKGTLTDLSDPRLRLNCTGSSRIEEIVRVAQIEEQLKGNGHISWTLDFEGPLGHEFKTTLNELRDMRWSGNVQLSEAQLQFNSGIPPIENLNASIDMKLGGTRITECSGKIGHMEFDGEVEIARLKDILTEPDSKIELAGNIHINELDVQQLPKEWQFESETNTESGSSRPVSVKVNATIDRILYNDFTASSVSGIVHMENEKLDVSNLRFMALDGNVRANLTYQPTATGYLLGLDGELHNIDMSRTLAEWNEFGQNTLTSKNLKGRASAILEADIYLDKDHQLQKDLLRVETDIEVSGGQLVKFEPLLAMSRFISVDELNEVKFDTLRNQLSIRNGKIYIPRMTVSSSILNVMVFGEHGFDQEMDYHVNLLMNDLLRRKAKKKETFDGHEIIDEKGKTRLFLWIRGRPGDLKVGFDKKEVKQKIKDDLKKEGQTIKKLFQDEFNGNSSQQEEQPEVQFRLEDNGINTPKKETEEQPETKPVTNEKPKKKKGFFNTEPEKEETEGTFEIEFDP